MLMVNDDDVIILYVSVLSICAFLYIGNLVTVSLHMRRVSLYSICCCQINSKQ